MFRNRSGHRQNDDRLRMAPDLIRPSSIHCAVGIGPATRGSSICSRCCRRSRATRSVPELPQIKSRAEALLVHPYLLKEYRNRWYVIAWNPDRSDYRTYGLDRMESVEEQDDGFALRSVLMPTTFSSTALASPSPKPHKMCGCVANNWA